MAQRPARASDDLFIWPRRNFVSDQMGQSLIIVALMFVILMAGAAMSVDIGRFYGEMSIKP